MTLTKVDIKRFLCRLLADQVEFAFLFGSWVGDGEKITPESDVDCAVFFLPSYWEDYRYFEIADEFEIQFERKLDLVCLNQADIIIAAQIIETGEELLVNSREKLNSYKAQVISRYLDFKQSRKIIEQHILVRPGHAG